MSAIEKACNILKWAIDNKKTITEACKVFGVQEKYLRIQKERSAGKDTKEIKEFLTLYAKFKGEDIPDGDLLDRDKVVDSPYLKFTEEQKNKGTLDARGSAHVRSLDSIIAEAKIDLKLWNIDRHVINKWDVTNGAGQSFQNWQVKVWLSKKVEVQEAIDASKIFKELIEESIKGIKHKPVTYTRKKERNLLEVNIFDLHLGKLCWGEEVNNNYDVKIASKRFMYALNTLIERSKGFDIDRIVFPVGNDFFNADNVDNTTTQGTRQDEDVRWQKSFKMGHGLLENGIDLLREIAPVDIVVIPGNHDVTKSFYLGEVLGAFYRNDKNVNVNNSANPRKYYEYGNVLIGYTHGNNEKIERLRSLMAWEAKEAWARTVYKEFHIGHQHRKLSVKHITKADFIQEELGIIVRSMSSLAGTDSWHNQQGYVGPTRAAEAFLWNFEAGLMGTFNANIQIGDDQS